MIFSKKWQNFFVFFSCSCVEFSSSGTFSGRCNDRFGLVFLCYSLLHRNLLTVFATLKKSQWRGHFSATQMKLASRNCYTKLDYVFMHMHNFIKIHAVLTVFGDKIYSRHWDFFISHKKGILVCLQSSLLQVLKMATVPSDISLQLHHWDTECVFLPALWPCVYILFRYHQIIILFWWGSQDNWLIQRHIIALFQLLAAIEDFLWSKKHNPVIMLEKVVIKYIASFWQYKRRKRRNFGGKIAISVPGLKTLEQQAGNIEVRSEFQLVLEKT